MFLQSLKHKFKLTTTTFRLISGESQILRRLSTVAPPVPSKTPPENRRHIHRQDLYQKIWSVVTSGERIHDVLFRVLRNGEQFLKTDLIFCLKDLRKFGHYNQCLEILDWMDKGRYGNAATDHALRINIMCKVKDIDEVEEYFDGISPDLKNQYVYGALLSCYCTKMMTDKALALFKKMDELNYASNDLTFSNLMSLYMKIGQPDKVPSLVEEMKQRNIRLTNHIYYIWIQSYRYHVNLEGLEQVMLEVQEQSSVNEDWQIHSNLAAVYIAAGQSENANAALKKMEELFDKPKKADRKAYHFLISMYASTGDSESVYQAWHKLKSRFSVCPNMSYLVMLRALSTLDDIEGLKKFLKEWDMSCINYDDRLPTVLIDAYLSHNMHEEAKHLLKDAEDKAEQKIRIAHVVFMNYYLEKHNFDSALKHMEAAMAANWKPLVDKLDPFFEHFKEEKDVNGAEDLCSKLEKVQAFNSRTWLLLLQVYAAAGKTAPEMRQRMEENGIDIGAEHEELLQKIC
ncbi:pentatricopeptide repeat-containing protein At4g01990, mitochondrial-like [Chenopodium quinoa]|uniref:Pentatricopeptide repeat-containing protein n=1 Tax=Chenopodium quinoa TaxID=63459 RepID=A0A803M7G9_CHEQI|nr:pentatricopeptide repeat-containing protein At4g01990, mitochondrial-like [Chenopodium quinoa]